MVLQWFKNAISPAPHTPKPFEDTHYSFSRFDHGSKPTRTPSRFSRSLFGFRSSIRPMAFRSGQSVKYSKFRNTDPMASTDNDDDDDDDDDDDNHDNHKSLCLVQQTSVDVNNNGCHLVNRGSKTTNSYDKINISQQNNESSKSEQYDGGSKSPTTNTASHISNSNYKDPFVMTTASKTDIKQHGDSTSNVVSRKNNTSTSAVSPVEAVAVSSLKSVEAPSSTPKRGISWKTPENDAGEREIIDLTDVSTQASTGAKSKRSSLVEVGAHQCCYEAPSFTNHQTAILRATWQHLIDHSNCTYSGVSGHVSNSYRLFQFVNSRQGLSSPSQKNVCQLSSKGGDKTDDNNTDNSETLSPDDTGNVRITHNDIDDNNTDNSGCSNSKSWNNEWNHGDDAKRSPVSKSSPINSSTNTSTITTGNNENTTTTAVTRYDPDTPSEAKPGAGGKESKLKKRVKLWLPTRNRGSKGRPGGTSAEPAPVPIPLDVVAVVARTIGHSLLHTQQFQMDRMKSVYIQIGRSMIYIDGGQLTSPIPWRILKRQLISYTTGVLYSSDPTAVQVALDAWSSYVNFLIDCLYIGYQAEISLLRYMAAARWPRIEIDKRSGKIFVRCKV